MSNRPGYYSPDEINFIFARLDPQDVERFYQSYQLWTLQQQVAQLQTQITTLQQQIAENSERMQQSQPSAIALAALARLQSHDVTNVELLDHMLARGEDWLDHTMQHLTYCEQFDFIRNNYTEWCQHALDGAYDWIDSMQNSVSSLREESHPVVSYATTTNDSLDEVTEEILLQKLMSEEEAFMLETTLKRPAVLAQDTGQIQSDESTISTQEEMILSEFSDIPDSSHVPIVQSLEVTQTEHSPVQGEFVPAEEAAPSNPSLAANEQTTEIEQTEHSPVQGEFVPAEVDNVHGATHTPVEQAAFSKQVEVETVSAESEEPSFAGDENPLSSPEIPPPISNNTSSRTEEPPLTEANSFSHQMASQVSTEQSNGGPQRTTRPRKKRGFLRRLFAVFFGR